MTNHRDRSYQTEIKGNMRRGGLASGEHWLRTDDDLRIISEDELEQDERLENLLAMIGVMALEPDEREYLLEHGFDPNTGERFD